MLDEGQVFYSAFGLSLLSNTPIPGLTPCPKSTPSTDIAIVLGSSPANSRDDDADRLEPYYVSTELDERGEPEFRIWSHAGGKILRMDYASGLRFWLDRAGTKLWCTWPENLTNADVAVYLLGPVLGFLLRLRGVTCLHASAVAIGERAIALAGPPGAGKSTTAAALGRKGHAIVSDDIAAIEESDGRFLVFPAHPYLGLWPESVEMLYGREESVPGFTSSWEKRRLSLADHDLRFQDRVLPLSAVFLLEERTIDSRAPFLDVVPPRDSLMSLIANSYGGNLLDLDVRAREFELLGRLAGTVPLYKVRPHADRSRLPALCDLIIRSCEALG
jgi:hypothetical protein